jgi:hypothetical protein
MTASHSCLWTVWLVNPGPAGTSRFARWPHDLLDNITLYWLTNTGVSSARLYWENKADFFDAKSITIPFAISVFPDELYQAPRSWAERAYPHNLVYYNRLDKGGHFAAWEQPDRQPLLVRRPGRTHPARLLPPATGPRQKIGGLHQRWNHGVR